MRTPKSLQPYPLIIITSPAVNADRLDPSRPLEIAQLRSVKVLAVGTVHGHDSEVLGAWSCGAFGNNLYEIAALFENAPQNNLNHDHGAMIRKCLSPESDKRLERLELLEPLELPGPASRLTPLSDRSNGSFPALNKVERQTSNSRRQPGSREKSLDGKARGAWVKKRKRRR